jgi:hypothetical protein
MATHWYLIQYIPDLYRREARNVGLALMHEGRGYARFLGQRSGEPCPTSAARTYEAWVNYLTHHLEAGTWQPALDTLSRRRSLDNFRVEHGGAWLGVVEDPQDLLDELFDQLVGGPVRPGPAVRP